MIDILRIIKEQMELIGINYEFMRMNTYPPSYPYWVGEYIEGGEPQEDQLSETELILNGFGRGNILLLENEKEIIKNHFQYINVSLDDKKSVICIYYNGSHVIQDEDMELKRVQVNLKIKKWRGNTQCLMD